MREPPCIVWNKKQSISMPILDKQHRAIVAAFNSLYFFIHKGWDLSALAPTHKLIETNVGFNLKTDEDF